MIFERIKKLYAEGKIKNPQVYIDKGLITAEQAKEIEKSHWKENTWKPLLIYQDTKMTLKSPI